jgi:DNA replication ATP-dependent helicase Dna2
MVTKENQIKFYSEELRELEFSVRSIFNATGISLFQNGSLYVGQYRGLDTLRGNVFVDIPSGDSYHAPRLDQRLTCFTLKEGNEKPNRWGNQTYSDLLKDRNRSETKIVDYIPSKRNGWITMLTRGLEAAFIENLEYNQLIAFGPTIPPFEYLQNLKEFSSSLNENGSEIWERILNFKYSVNSEAKPNPLTEDIDIAASINEDVDKNNVYVFQGPPGTGKTHQVADLASRLVLNNKSVLITALTNKAAVEACEKPFFEKLFNEERVSKLPLSLDEKKKFPKLLSTKDLVPVKGHLKLTTYYQFSSIWIEQHETYDYIIVEEASQAYLTTIAAACKVGKKVIVVGDPKQIVPFVTNKNYKIFPNIDYLIHGMKTLSQIKEFSLNRKIETRRLSKRSTDFTNSFYNNSIQSISLFDKTDSDISKTQSLRSIIHKDGGPSLILFNSSVEDVLHQMIRFLVQSVNELLAIKGNSVAVLTPYIETLTSLQQKLKTQTNSRNYLIETVDRVQGLDVDYCFYVIPKSSSFSFNLNRFNVATSRAKKSTFILVIDDYYKLVNLPPEVEFYMKKLHNSFTFQYDNGSSLCRPVKSTTNNLNFKERSLNTTNGEVKSTNQKLGLKVVGHMDLSKFNRPSKELKPNKNNIYIIDTNVFVDNPEIISKIDKKYPIVLSAKVLDELDNLKSTLDSEGQHKVQKALKSININIDNRELSMEIADVSLLPNDFNKRSPDNMILSVALKFKNENPIILTSDNGLQIKAKGLSLNNYFFERLSETTKKNMIGYSGEIDPQSGQTPPPRCWFSENECVCQNYSFS